MKSKRLNQSILSIIALFSVTSCQQSSFEGDVPIFLEDEQSVSGEEELSGLEASQVVSIDDTFGNGEVPNVSVMVANDPTCNYEKKWAPPKGGFEANFKVLTMNIFGQVSLFAADDPCEDRHLEIGEHILENDYDFVGFQEWHPDTLSTCSGTGLSNFFEDYYPGDVSNDGEQLPTGMSWSQHQWGHPIAPSQKDGGLGFISTSPVLWEDYSAGIDPGVETYNVHQFIKGEDDLLDYRTAHGFIFTRVYLRYPDIAVDVYTVHLTSSGRKWRGGRCGDACKAGMLEQLREGIHERSSASGNPVLVMGDFNIGGPNPTSAECKGNKGYGSIMENLGNPKDVWLESHPGQSGTTHEGERIDFMFIPDVPYLVNSDYEIVVPNAGSVKLRDWTHEVEVLTDPHFPQRTVWKTESLSDHIALEANFQIRKKLSWATVIAVTL